MYAIPYEGEEVKLHWANADQYYIKTDEYLRNYAFRLRPEVPTDPMRVRFCLADATEGEHGNARSRRGANRVFVLCIDDFIAETDGERGKELVVRFEYRTATLADWPEEERAGKRKPPVQTDLVRLAETRLLDGANRHGLARWVKALSAHVRTSDGQNPRSCLLTHLIRYTARNSFDYFVHKDLRSFLRNELDFYIKNEVMHLDDIEEETAPRVEQYLSKIKVLRRIAHKLISFLAQLEDFQKKLWLKKKFVVQTSYCIRLGCIPEDFHNELCANEAQRREWRSLLGCAADADIQEVARVLGTNDPVGHMGVEGMHPSLAINSRHFDATLVDRILACMSDTVPLDDQCDGVVIQGDNLHALYMMHGRYRNHISCAYIDPPYNTGNDDFLYKDNYQHSSWLSMIQDRMRAGRHLLSDSGAMICSIDETEQPNLRKAMDRIFGSDNYVADMIWAAGRKNNSRLVSVSHEYMIIYAANRHHLSSIKTEWRQKKRGLNDIYAHYKRLKRLHGDDYSTMTTEMKKWFRELPNSHPAKAHRHYSCIDHRGPYFPDNISAPGGNGPRYEVLHPETNRPVRVPAPGWRLTEQKMSQYLLEDRIHFGEDEGTVPCQKSYLQNRQYQVPYSVLYQDGRAATKRLGEVMGTSQFDYPKDETVIAELVGMVLGDDGIVLDFFAGTGTTAHSVMNLNRLDGGKRKFILVEIGDHFDTILLPRIKKVIFTPEWKAGKPRRGPTPEEAERSPRIVKVLRLESYEDALNNLIEPRRTDAQQATLDLATEEESSGLPEEYRLRYMLDVETRGSQSLLNVAEFMDPTAYRMNVKRPGSDESREVNVDLLETFNWLLGLTVHRIRVPETFDAEVERDQDEKRLRLKGELVAHEHGQYWFRTVSGVMPDGRTALVIWRKRPGGDTPDGIERDNLVLDEWFSERKAELGEHDVIYVNGSSTLANLKEPGDTWTVRLIEDDFHRLMFDTGDG